METTTLPGVDLELSRVGLGTWAIGGDMWGGTDERAALRTIEAAVDRGVRLIDTAPVYGFGRSERIVGRALARGGRRERVVLATKAGLVWDEDGNVRRDSSADRLRLEVEESLERLRTDRIDLYQVHWPDASTSFEETAHTLAELRREGKIRAIGVSNYSPDQMEAFRQAAHLSSAQPPYNLFERGIEDDLLPYCRDNGIAVIAYGALCRGLLSGRMDRGRRFPGDDLRRQDPKFRQPRFDRYLAAAEELGAFARERFDKGLLALAVRWLLDRPGVTAALWGARSPEQLEPLDEVFGWSLDEAAMREIDRILERRIREPVGPEFMAPPG